MKKQIIGYWCTKCADSGNPNFMFKKEGYCQCGEDVSYSTLGVDRDGNGLYGVSDKDLKKIRKNWKPAFIEISH